VFKSIPFHGTHVVRPYQEVKRKLNAFWDGGCADSVGGVLDRVPACLAGGICIDWYRVIQADAGANVRRSSYVAQHSRNLAGDINCYPAFTFVLCRALPSDIARRNQRCALYLPWHYLRPFIGVIGSSLRTLIACCYLYIGIDVLSFAMVSRVWYRQLLCYELDGNNHKCPATFRSESLRSILLATLIEVGAMVLVSGATRYGTSASAFRKKRLICLP
jgi:hypothetical protein